MGEIIAADFPQVGYTLSHLVTQEYREYERSMTTLVDAAVKPTMARYVANISSRLRDLAPDVPFYVNIHNAKHPAGAMRGQLRADL